MPRARTPGDRLGSWEEFSLCSSDRRHTAYATAPPGHLVTAEVGHTGAAHEEMKATGAAAGPREVQARRRWSSSSYVPG